MNIIIINICIPANLKGLLTIVIEFMLPNNSVWFNNCAFCFQMEMTEKRPDNFSVLSRTFRDSLSQPRNVQDSMPLIKLKYIYLIYMDNISAITQLKSCFQIKICFNILTCDVTWYLSDTFKVFCKILYRRFCQM